MTLNLALRLGAIAAAAAGFTTITDSFNRANSTSTLGTADTGQAWSALTNTWGINGNQAYTPTSANDSLAVLDAGITNQRVTATFSVLSTDSGLLARCQDASNYYLAIASAGGTALYKRVAGTYTQIGTTGSGVVNGDIITFNVNGSNLELLVNGVSRRSGSDSSLTTGTRAGIRVSTNAARMEDFKVEAAL